MRSLSLAMMSTLAVLALTPAGAAPTQPATSKASAARTPEKMTCREFVALDDSFKPQAVSYAIGYDDAKRAHVEFVSVEGLDTITPIVGESCRKRPTETLIAHVKANRHKL